MVIQQTTRTGDTADIVIVGGGVIGLTVARALALRGVADLLLLDRGGLGGESSYAAAGMLAPQAEADGQDDFLELACRSRGLYPAFAAALHAETGTDIELDPTGTLYLALNEKDEQEIQQRYSWQQAAGLPVERLTPGEARRLEPGIAEAVRGALRFPLDLQVENRRLLLALIAANKQLGTRLHTDTQVESVAILNGRVAGVETERGFIATRQVVVASGAWTSSLAESASSSNRLPRIPIVPVRGQMLCFTAPAPLVRHVIYSPRGYLVPRRDGRILAGSTTEHVGYAKQTTASGIHAILANALELAPALGSLPLADSWSGLRPRAEDDLPVLGPSQIEGLYYATGHYRNGILLAPITGELLAEAIVDNVVSSLLRRFSPQRFEQVDVI